MPDDFFIGWSGRLPRAQRWAVPSAVMCLLIVFAVLPLALARATDDPGPGDFDWTAGDQVLEGTLTRLPYPTLWIPPDAAHAQGHTIMLSGDGKYGPDLDPGSDGRFVRARGIMLKRGSLDMLQVNERPAILEGNAPTPPVTPLGQWRITGEICDGKCETGAMRPGRGIAHRACANLCLIGGVPPVYVSTGPIEGSEFLLMSGPDGHPLPDNIRDFVALPITLQGEVERRGDLLIFRSALP